MKRLIYLLLVFSNVVACCLVGRAQGTVVFTNFGGGVIAPVIGPDGLLGSRSGFMAQLQLADSTNVGDPAPFLANGWFVDGTRTVDGAAPGETVDLQVAVSNSDGSVTGVSEVISITLGGDGTPPTPPAALAGLIPFEVRTPPYYA